MYKRQEIVYYRRERKRKLCFFTLLFIFTFHVVAVNIQTLTNSTINIFFWYIHIECQWFVPCSTPKNAFFRMRDRLSNKTIPACHEIHQTTFLEKRYNDTKVFSSFTILLFQIIYATIICLWRNTSKIEQNRNIKLLLHKAIFNTQNKQFHYLITFRIEFLPCAKHTH